VPDCKTTFVPDRLFTADFPLKEGEAVRDLAIQPAVVEMMSHANESKIWKGMGCWSPPERLSRPDRHP
jgi:hypothetical protein